MESKRHIVAIIQARMGAKRLPGKVMIDIEGQTVLAHVIQRVRASRLIDTVVVATTTLPADDVIIAEALRCGVQVFRGSMEDVLSRYYHAAKEFHAETIVRITADCPLIDPKIIDLVIGKHVNSSKDYTSNTLKRTYPRGLDVEAFEYAALEKIYNLAQDRPEREHVTVYFYKHPELFKLNSVETQTKFCRSDIRICIDQKEDLDLVRRIYQEFLGRKELFFLKDIIDLFDKKPELLLMNSAVKQEKI